MSFYRGKYAIAVIETKGDLIEALYDDCDDMAERMGITIGASARMCHRAWYNMLAGRKRYDAYVGARLEFVDMFEEWRGKPLADFIRDWPEFSDLHLKIFDGERKRRFKSLRSRQIKSYLKKEVKDIEWTMNVIRVRF